MKVIDEKLAIDMAASGVSLKKIATALGVSHQFLYEYRENNPAFGDKIARAAEAAIDALVDELLTVDEDIPDVQRARLRSENIKWVASKRKPKNYGDRIDLNVDGQISLTAALDAARSRVLPIRDQHIIIEGQVIDNIDEFKNEPTDSLSVAGSASTPQKES